MILYYTVKAANTKDADQNTHGCAGWSGSDCLKHKQVFQWNDSKFRLEVYSFYGFSLLFV